MTFLRMITIAAIFLLGAFLILQGLEGDLMLLGGGALIVLVALYGLAKR